MLALTLAATTVGPSLVCLIHVRPARARFFPWRENLCVILATPQLRLSAFILVCRGHWERGHLARFFLLTFPYTEGNQWLEIISS